MIYKYIQIPHLGLATPALIITIFYLIIIATLIFYERNKENLTISFVSFPKLKRDKINKIILSFVGYIILIFSCIYLRSLLGEENVIIKFSESYLKYETIVFFVVLLFLCSSLLNPINKETHLRASNRVLHYLVWISIGAGLLSSQIDYTFFPNKVVLACGGVLNILFLIVEIKSNESTIPNLSRFDMISYNPINDVDKLFPLHRQQAEEIANIISSSSNAPFSICISGFWGTGKTSVVRGIINILKKLEENTYEFIYINALELDNKETMFRYLFAQIKQKLKSHGAYVGIDSEYKEFLSSATGTLTSNTIGNLLQKIISRDSDYILQKKQLEQIIERTFKNGKLIVVVDDLERCDKDVAREYLSLIKEVATMKNCVSVFVTDYDILNKLISDGNTFEKQDNFLDKFFNYKINLIEETAENVFEYYDNFFKKDDPAFNSIYKLVCQSPKTWYTSIITAMDSIIKGIKLEKSKTYLKEETQKSLERNLKKQEDLKELFEKRMLNPRTIAKFYNVFRHNALNCEKYLSKCTSEEKLAKYISSRNIGQIVFLLSFTEVCLPYEYQLLTKKGSRYAESPIYGEGESANLERQLLIELNNGLVFGKYFDFKEPSPYIKDDIRKFIDVFLHEKKILSQLLNTYTTHEEEWLDAIKNSDRTIIKTHWIEMMLMVLGKTPNVESGITNKWRNDTFSFLLEFAKHQIEIGEWTTDNIFIIFNRDLHTDRTFATGNGLMQMLWKHLDENTTYTKPSNEIVEELIVFSNHYSYNRISSTYRLFHYLISNKSNESKIENIQEYMLDSTKLFSKNISVFLDKIKDILPNLQFSSDKWYENYKMLTNEIKAYLTKQGIVDFPDVKDDVEHMLGSADEMFCLEKIINWAQDNNINNINTSSAEFSQENVDKIIERFENVFSSTYLDIRNKNDVERDFAEFFRWMQNEPNLTITKDQAKRLHELVSEYVKQSGYSSLPYRKTIIQISKKKD